MPTSSDSGASALSGADGGADDKAPPVASSLPATRDAANAPPSPPPAPATLAASETDAVAVVYAPVLPIDVLRMVFEPLKCDVETLSAAACVSVAWRAAALEPSLWRLTRLSFAPHAARKVTNEALRMLVQRTGSSLQRVNLVGCVQLNTRGVATALRGKQLDALAMRGVKFPMSQSSKTLELLQKLVRRPTGLDVSKSPTCGARRGEGRCSRLCGPQDMLCETCSVARCTQCVKFAKARRKPPCRHLCDGCFRGNHVLMDCEACGRVPNGFCAECTHECDACNDAVFCGDCRFSPGALIKCAGDDCDAAYCNACVFDKPGSLLFACQGCSARFCDSCAFEVGEMLFCERCDEFAFCSDCAETMTVDGLLFLCPDCAAELDSDDGSSVWSTDSGDDSE